jgi:glucosamine-phosphate N-acetyltransferase
MAGQISHAAQLESGSRSELLFDPALLIPSTATIATSSTSAATPAPARADTPFPEGYTVRPLARDDYEKGFLDVLRVLTHTGDVSRAAFEGRFDDMKAINAARGVHFYLVVEFEGRVVGTGTVIVERKL